MTKKICAVIVILSMFSSFSVPAFAADGAWINTGVTGGSWTNTDNWLTAVVPGATTGVTNTDIATFNTALAGDDFGSSSSPVIIDPNRNIGGINFDLAAGNYFIGNLRFTLSLIPVAQHRSSARLHPRMPLKRSMLRLLLKAQLLHIPFQMIVPTVQEQGPVYWTSAAALPAVRLVRPS